MFVPGLMHLSAMSHSVGPLNFILQDFLHQSSQQVMYILRQLGTFDPWQGGQRGDSWKA